MSSNVDIKNLTAEERLALLAEIWDSLDPEDVPVTDAQRTELDRRLDDLERDRDLGFPWQEVLRQIRDRSTSGGAQSSPGWECPEQTC